MDKDVMKRLLRDAKIPIAKFITIHDYQRHRFFFENVAEELGVPFFVKPANLGSSVGISKVKNKEGFEADNVVFDLGYLKEPFNHTIYPEKGEIRQVAFPASESEGYIPLTCLHPLLPQLIVFSEDFHFYLHAGVDSYFIGRAIVSNIKKRKIVRGASTITMQLCKNLFLTEERSIIRKLEEMAISLIMEQIFDISKDRILELYMNVIEFAPMVYGIKEASYFYFDKHPNDLSITEALVMTYIIPRPIHFYDALMTRSQRLVINMGNYIDELIPRLINNRMTIAFENIDKKIVFGKRFGVLELSQ